VSQASKPVRFPARFLWGASIAAHQVEGGNHNQWSVWELESAKSLAHAAEYHYGDLDAWPHIKDEAKRPDNYVSGKAVEHYDRFKEDFKLAKSMHLNALRFSVEWSRIEPTEGAWNAREIEHYKTYVNELLQVGIEPVVTLFHFTLPVWFTEKGGFEKRSNTQYFLRFAEKILQELGGSIRFIITINEPEVYATESYLEGHWPPMRQNKFESRRVLNNLIYAHTKAAKLIHGMNRRYKVSIAKNSNYFYAGDDARLSLWSTAVMQYVQDDYVLRRVYKTCDFLGVNFYFSNRVYGYRVHNPDERTSDMGWDLSPDHIEYALERLYKKYHLPIIITENGLADASDIDRQWWLSRTIIAMRSALDQGVDIRGYLHWSLLDNFEWDKGFWPRFGLIEVDQKTMRRTLRPSAKRYGAFIRKLQEGAKK
jgi:beta-glucosidase